MRMCWAAFALDAEESGWDDFITSRKSISSSPSLSVSDDAATTANTTLSSIPEPHTPQSASLPVSENQIWTSAMTKFEPAAWNKEVGAVPIMEPVVIDADDVDMVMDMDLDVQQAVTDIVLSSSAPAATTIFQTGGSIVTQSEQQEWIKTIDAQIEQNQKQLEFTTVEIARVEEVIKPGKRYIPTKITAYFPSSPILSIPSLNLDLSSSSSYSSSASSPKESVEERKQREILEELAKSLSSVSLRTRARTQQVSKPKPPPIGIGMMMGFRSAKSETPSPKLKSKEIDLHTKITKRGVIAGTRGGVGKVRGMVRRRNSAGRGDTICL